MFGCGRAQRPSDEASSAWCPAWLADSADYVATATVGTLAQFAPEPELRIDTTPIDGRWYAPIILRDEFSFSGYHSPSEAFSKPETFTHIDTFMGAIKALAGDLSRVSLLQSFDVLDQVQAYIPTGHFAPMMHCQLQAIRLHCFRALLNQMTPSDLKGLIDCEVSASQQPDWATYNQSLVAFQPVCSRSDTAGVNAAFKDYVQHYFHFSFFLSKRFRELMQVARANMLPEKLSTVVQHCRERLQQEWSKLEAQVWHHYRHFEAYQELKSKVFGALSVLDTFQGELQEECEAVEALLASLAQSSTDPEPVEAPTITSSAYASKPTYRTKTSVHPTRRTLGGSCHLFRAIARNPLVLAAGMLLMNARGAEANVELTTELTFRNVTVTEMFTHHMRYFNPPCDGMEIPDSGGRYYACEYYPLQHLKDKHTFADWIYRDSGAGAYYSGIPPKDKRGWFSFTGPVILYSCPQPYGSYSKCGARIGVHYAIANFEVINRVPQPITPVKDIVINVGAFSETPVSVVDPDEEDVTYTYSFPAYPWLNWDTRTGRIFGTAPPGSQGNLTVDLSVTDAWVGESVRAQNITEGIYKTTFEFSVLNLPPNRPVAPRGVVVKAGDEAIVPIATPSDPDGDVTDISILAADGGNLPSGSAYAEGLQVFSWVTSSAMRGVYHFKVQACDRVDASVRQCSDSDSFAVTVENNSPEARVTLSPTTAWIATELCMDMPGGAVYDRDLDVLTWTVRMADGSAIPSGVSVDPATGRLCWTPPVGTPKETHSFQMVARDPSGAEATLSRFVAVGNRDPHRHDLNPLRLVTGPVGSQYVSPDLRTLYGDPDGDAPRLVIGELPGSMMVNGSHISGEVPERSVGAHAVELAVSDASGGSLADSVVLEIPNTPPLLTGVPLTHTMLVGTETLHFTASDPDNPSAGGVRFEVRDPLPFGREVRSDGSMVLSPVSGQQAAYPPCQIVAIDADGGETVRLMTLTVDNRLVLPRPGAATQFQVYAGFTETVNALSLVRDGDHDPLAVRFVRDDSNIPVTLGDTTLTFAPRFGLQPQGNYSMTVHYDDGHGSTLAVRVGLEVPNQAPVAERAQLADCRFSDADETACSLRDAARDPDGDPLTSHVVGLPEGICRFDAAVEDVVCREVWYQFQLIERMAYLHNCDPSGACFVHPLRLISSARGLLDTLRDAAGPALATLVAIGLIQYFRIWQYSSGKEAVDRKFRLRQDEVVALRAVNDLLFGTAKHDDRALVEDEAELEATLCATPEAAGAAGADKTPPPLTLSRTLSTRTVDIEDARLTEQDVRRQSALATSLITQLRLLEHGVQHILRREWAAADTGTDDLTRMGNLSKAAMATQLDRLASFAAADFIEEVGRSAPRAAAASAAFPSTMISPLQRFNSATQLPGVEELASPTTPVLLDSQGSSSDEDRPSAEQGSSPSSNGSGTRSLASSCTADRADHSPLLSARTVISEGVMPESPPHRSRARRRQSIRTVVPQVETLLGFLEEENERFHSSVRVPLLLVARELVDATMKRIIGLGSAQTKLLPELMSVYHLGVSVWIKVSAGNQQATSAFTALKMHGLLAWLLDQLAGATVAPDDINEPEVRLLSFVLLRYMRFLHEVKGFEREHDIASEEKHQLDWRVRMAWERKLGEVVKKLSDGKKDQAFFFAKTAHHLLRLIHDNAQVGFWWLTWMLLDRLSNIQLYYDKQALLKSTANPWIADVFAVVALVDDMRSDDAAHQAATIQYLASILRSEGDKACCLLTRCGGKRKGAEETSEAASHTTHIYTWSVELIALGLMASRNNTNRMALLNLLGDFAIWSPGSKGWVKCHVTRCIAEALCGLLLRPRAGTELVAVDAFVVQKVLTLLNGAIHDESGIIADKQKHVIRVMMEMMITQREAGTPAPLNDGVMTEVKSILGTPLRRQRSRRLSRTPSGVTAVTPSSPGAAAALDVGGPREVFGPAAAALYHKGAAHRADATSPERAPGRGSLLGSPQGAVRTRRSALLLAGSAVDSKANPLGTQSSTRFTAHNPMRKEEGTKGGARRDGRLAALFSTHPSAGSQVVADNPLALLSASAASKHSDGDGATAPGEGKAGPRGAELV